jgi:hypothetical protein
MRKLIPSAFGWSIAFLIATLHAADPLASWNDGPNKKAIVTFVERVTKEGSPDFVPLPERIATFDNDGTLWCEQPMYVQFFFAFDRVKDLAPTRVEWKEREPFASLLKGTSRGRWPAARRGWPRSSWPPTPA